MKTTGDRVRDARRNLGLDQASLAKRAGVRQSTISHLESGRNKTSRSLPEIAEALGVTYEYLRYGDDSNIVTMNVSERSARYGHRNMIPLISFVQAGSWNEASNPYELGDAEDWFPAPPEARRNSYALRVKGDSMTSPHPGARSYPEGTIIYVNPGVPGPYEGKRVIAKNGDNEATFKEFVTDGAQAYLKPLNPQYPMIHFDDEFEIIGLVIGSYIPE